MDELTLFFGGDESSSFLSSGPKTCQNPAKRNKYVQYREASVKFVENATAVGRHSSYPTIPTLDTFGLSPKIHVSKSFCGTSNLPLALPPEVEEGNIEYKLKLIAPDKDRVEHLVTQMKWRLNEGGGQAIYRLGVDDNGLVTGLTASEMAASISTVHQMAKRLSANLSLLRECTINTPISSQGGGCGLSGPVRTRKAIELHVRRRLPVNQGLPDLCIAMLGSMDVGKSTLLGVLTDGELDNGRGCARLNLFRHLHEVQSGRTSSLASEVIGFDATGRLINRRRSQGRLNKRTIDEVVRDSKRLITLLDLAGHPKYQRTTLSGLARSTPSFAILVVSATAGLTPEGLDHARTAAALSIPLAVVISKLDLIQNSDIDVAEVKNQILKKLRSITFYQLPDLEGRPLKSFRCFKIDPPVFALSSVSGDGLDELLVFLSHVSAAGLTKPDFGGLLVSPLLAPDTTSKGFFDEAMEETKGASAISSVEVWVTRVFWQVPGVNFPVIEGLVKSGQVCENQRLWLGPNEDGCFEFVKVLELRRNRQPHTVLYSGQMGSFVVIPEPETGDLDVTTTTTTQSPVLVRRGMVMLSSLPTATAEQQPPSKASGSVCWSFSVHSLTLLPCGKLLGPGGCPLPPVNATIGIYSSNVCQHAKVIESGVSTNTFTDLDPATCIETSLFHLSSVQLSVQFLRKPEYLTRGRRVILCFHQGTKAVGLINSLSNIVPPQHKETDVTQSIWKSVDIAQPLGTSMNSLDSLLHQVGINSQGTKFIGEDDGWEIIDNLEPGPTMAHIIHTRKYRQSKRRRKLALKAAAVTILESAEQQDEYGAQNCGLSSSTSTWNSSISEPPKAAEFLAGIITDCQVTTSAHSSSHHAPPCSSVLPSNPTMPTICNNRAPTKKRKRRHRRSKK